MEKINKLSLPATIIIACVILGGFYYASQVNKQKSIEKQQQIELQAKTDAEQKAKAEADVQKQLNATFLDACLSDADDNYNANWDANCKTSGINKKTSGCTLSLQLAQNIDSARKDAKDLCLKKYPPK